MFINNDCNKKEYEQTAMMRDLLKKTDDILIRLNMLERRIDILCDTMGKEYMERRARKTVIR